MIRPITLAWAPRVLAAFGATVVACSTTRSTTGPPPPTTGTVSGQVTSTLGGGMGSITVVVSPDSGPQPPAVQTAGDGSYTVTNVRTGAGKVYLAGMPTDVPTDCTDPSPVSYSGLTGGGTTTLNVVITCTPTGTVSGTITTSLGGGIVGVGVVVTPAGSPQVIAQTGPDGLYVVAPVSIGSGSVAVRGVPPNCNDVAPVPYSGLTRGGTATVNAFVRCARLRDAVTGRVALPFEVSADVIVTPTGGPALPAVTPTNNGFYAVTGVPVGDGTGSVVPHVTGHGFRTRGCDKPVPVSYSGLTSTTTVTADLSVICH